MFKVPKDLLDNWRRAIPKRDIKLGPNSYICSKHFKSDEILWFWTSGTGESQISVCFLILLLMYILHIVEISS